MQKLSKIVFKIFLLIVSFATILVSKTNAQSSDSSITLLHSTPSSIVVKKSFLSIPDSLNKKRLHYSIGLMSGVTVTEFTGLYFLWYANYPISSFKFIDDMGEWNQFDKFSHTQATYIVTKTADHILRWTGMKRKKAVILAGIIGTTEHSLIEVCDGFSAGWGASMGDFGANVLGSAIYVGQELIWEKQIVKIKYGFHGGENYTDPIIQERITKLFGSGFIGREMKNYNGANVWFSAATSDIFPKQKKFKWLAVAVGYGSGGMYGGYENKWTANINGKDTLYDYSTIIPRYRRILIAPDIDLEKIPAKKPGWKMLLGILNYFKWPTPAFEINTKGEFIFYPIYEMGFNYPIFLKR